MSDDLNALARSLGDAAGWVLSVQQENERLAAIVRDLAALRVTTDLLIECPCAIREHKPECPWRRAVEWVRDQETKTWPSA